VASAATLTPLEASFDAATALVADCALWLAAVESDTAVDFIAMALAPNEVSSVSMPVRNAAIAASTAPRRCCCATMASRCSCRRCCSVTSSCVETQPPSAIGTLMAWTMRPSLALTVHFEISPAATPSRISLQYCAGSPVH
jgi:hypothetical protein